jgi:hypothetical protein
MSTRIAFAHRVHNARWRSAFATVCVTMCNMDALDMEIQAAAKERAEAEAVFKRADDRLRALLVKGRAAQKGPSHMAKLTGFTREWVAKIAPDPGRRVPRAD